MIIHPIPSSSVCSLAYDTCLDMSSTQHDVHHAPLRHKQYPTVQLMTRLKHFESKSTTLRSA